MIFQGPVICVMFIDCIYCFAMLRLMNSYQDLQKIPLGHFCSAHDLSNPHHLEDLLGVPAGDQARTQSPAVSPFATVDRGKKKVLGYFRDGFP